MRSTLTGFVWNTKMTTVSLFWNTNMAAAKSRENALYGRKATLHAQYTFWYISLPLFGTTTTHLLTRGSRRTYTDGNFLLKCINNQMILLTVLRCATVSLKQTWLRYSYNMNKT